MQHTKNSIVITGASRGLGEALTRTFLDQSWTVAPLVRTNNDATILKKLNPGLCFPIISDVTSHSLSEAVHSVLSHLGPVEILINNAGTGSRGPTLEETDPDAVLSSLNVHCIGALRMTQAVMPFMASHGKTINITSRFGSITMVSSGELDHLSCSYAYRIAKAAQNMLTQCLCREFDHSDLNVCAIHPGQLKTDSASQDAHKTPDEAAKAIYELTPHIKHGRFYSLFEGELPW